MKIARIAGAVCATSLALAISTSALAAPVSGQGTWETTLLPRDLDGNLATAEAYYDTVLAITWLADANYTGFSVNWYDANSVMAYLFDAYGSGISGWRLPIVTDTDGPDPDTLPDDGCDFTFTGGTDCNYNVDTATSEPAHMYYVTLGNKAPYDTSGSPQSGWGLTNTGPFSDLMPWLIWSATEYAPDTSEAWSLDFGSGTSGRQLNTDKTTPAYIWAVHDGDVGAPVPMPTAAWLLGSGLIAILGFGRRKR